MASIILILAITHFITESNLLFEISESSKLSNVSLLHIQTFLQIKQTKLTMKTNYFKQTRIECLNH